MGANLCRNMLNKGFRVDACDNEPKTGEVIIAEGHAGFYYHRSLETLIAELESPRCLLLMVPAGDAVDQTITGLIPLLSPGDIVVDLGNSHYKDTERRLLEAAKLGVRFIGCGISGGSRGARHGAALMPGGDITAWPSIQDVFESIAASFNGKPCVSWIGPGGAGHFVKTVHNGIEYADMQLIAESYHLMRVALGLDCDQIGKLFETWNQGPLGSYLVQITAKILQTREADGCYLVDRILDRAGQKGTGTWTGHATLDYAVPATMLVESVYARMLSARKDQRLRVRKQYPEQQPETVVSVTTDSLEKALYAAKVLAYAQGFDLLQQSSQEHEWALNLASIASGWRAGCVIRGELLQPAMQSLEQEPGKHLIESDKFRDVLADADSAMRDVVKLGVDQTIPLPGFSAALTYLDGMRCEILPATLIQAQREFFGSHGFERIDGKPGELHHYNWADQTS